jgi:Family of unknown function (DUF5719)
MMRRLALLGGVLLALALVAVFALSTKPAASRATATATAVASGQAAAVTSVTRSCPPAAPGAGAPDISMIAVPAQSAAPSSAGTAKAAGTAVTGTAAAGTATVSSVPAAPVAPAANPTKGKLAKGKRAAGSAPTASTTPTPGNTTSTSKNASTTKTAPAAPVTVSVPGAATTVTAPGGNDGGGTAVSATGQMAEGFEAEQADSSGMGLVSCSHPSSDMWFVGSGEPDVWLYLTNSGTAEASVDVTILTDTGQQSGLSDAITVAPDQVIAENVSPYVHGAQAIAMQVQTSSGQIAASVWEGSGSGHGAWLPQAAAPSTTVVIPGLTVASSSARLFVTVPGATDAKVKIVAYTPAGAYTQFGTVPVQASAAATTPVTLSSLGASAAGLELTSNVPIVAGVLVPGAGIGAFTAGAVPVTDQGVVAGNPATRGLTVGLLLTAPGAAAAASVSVIASDGTVTSPASLQDVTVAAGRTLAVAVPRPSGREPFAIVLAPKSGSGPLYATRVVTSGTGGLSAEVTSLLPVQSALTQITLPPVQNSYTAVLP